MKTVDRDDSSRATTAYPRVRSSRNARVMTTRVKGCSAAVFDRAWIILTTGARGFMKVPRWLYCSVVLNAHFCTFVIVSVFSDNEYDIGTSVQLNTHLVYIFQHNMFPSIRLCTLYYFCVPHHVAKA